MPSINKVNADRRGDPVKVRCIAEVPEINERYRPVVGRIYDGWKGNRPRKRKQATDFVVVDILDKRIVLRAGEYEIVGV